MPSWSGTARPSRRRRAQQCTQRAPVPDAILEFDEIRGDLLAEVGGKAGNLGELTRAGLPVPPGFCLTTQAYRLAADDLLSPVLDALDHVDPSDQSALSAVAGRARAILLAAPMPPEVARAVTQAYRSWGEGHPVAVRSSATAEDLPF